MAGIIIIQVFEPKNVRKNLADVLANQCALGVDYNYLSIKRGDNIITEKGDLETMFKWDELNKLEYKDFIVFRHGFNPVQTKIVTDIVLFNQSLNLNDFDSLKKYVQNDIVISLKDGIRILAKDDLYLRYLDDNMVMSSKFLERGKNMRNTMISINDKLMKMEDV